MYLFCIVLHRIWNLATLQWMKTVNSRLVSILCYIAIYSIYYSWNFWHLDTSVVCYCSVLFAICYFYHTQWTYNCRRFCFWRRQSVVFCLCMKYLGNRRTDLRHIHTEDMLGPSLGQVWWLRSRSRSPGTKMAFFGPFAACVQVMFGRTSLSSSYNSFGTDIWQKAVLVFVFIATVIDFIFRV